MLISASGVRGLDSLARLGMAFPSLWIRLSGLLCFLVVSLVVLEFGLLPGILAGCTSYAVSAWLLPRIDLIAGSDGDRPALVRSILKRLAVLLIIVLPLIALGLGAAALPGLMQSAVVEVDAAVRAFGQEMPVWLKMLPDPVQQLVPWLISDFQPASTEFLQDQIRTAASLGAKSLHSLLIVVAGLVIGALLALDIQNSSPRARGPLTLALNRWGGLLHCTFTAVVVSQFWIAATNAVLTAVFLYGVLPLFQAHLPYRESLVLFTFLVGMLPVVGNLICNVVLTLVGLSVSPQVALACLAWLVAIHKLEYLIAAKVMGKKIGFSTWELLLAMISMEAIFGVQGLVAAPLIYAMGRQELHRLRLA